MAAALAIRDWAREWQVPPYDEERLTGILRHAMARASQQGVLAVVVTTGPLPHKEALVEKLRRAVPGLVGIVHNRNRAASNVILGKEYETIWGSGRLQVRLCGLDFSVSPASFLQVNPRQTQRLYEKALDMLALRGGETVLDVYCGIGTISLLLARHAGHVTGVENVPEAVEDARMNARNNGIENVDFICAPAEEALPAWWRLGALWTPFCWIHPGRDATRQPFQAILKSGAPRLVYVSATRYPGPGLPHSGPGRLPAPVRPAGRHVPAYGAC